MMKYLKLSALSNDHNASQPVICIPYNGNAGQPCIYSTLILEIIVYRRPLTLRHTLLLPIHLRHLS